MIRNLKKKDRKKNETISTKKLKLKGRNSVKTVNQLVPLNVYDQTSLHIERQPQNGANVVKRHSHYLLSLGK